MSGCTHCGTTIIFGGKKADGLRYCSEKCLEQGELAREIEAVPPEVLEHALREAIAGLYEGLKPPALHRYGETDNREDEVM